MARTVDPVRLTQRRSLILAAAYRQFATTGYERTTTASICREAGISSGTFFHYFPTKLAVLVMLLHANAESTTQHLDRISRFDRGLPAILDHVREVERERATEHSAGFANAIAGVVHLPQVAAAVNESASSIDDFLRGHLEVANAQGDVRSDVAPEQLAAWTRWLLDGAARDPLGATPPAGALIQAVQTLLTSR